MSATPMISDPVQATPEQIDKALDRASAEQIIDEAVAQANLPPNIRVLTELEVQRLKYPKSGTGKRQGERVARFVARSWNHPFAASNRCIERIKARLAAKAAA